MLLACGAVATAYIGLPLATPPSDKDFEVHAAPVDTPPPVVQPVPVDFAASASRLQHLANAPRIVAAVPDAPSDATPTKEPPPMPGLSDVKYLGFANVGTMRMALLNVNAKQRFVREGQVLDAERVKQIDPEYVVLTHDQDERRIELQERTGERVTRLIGGPAANPQQPPMSKFNGTIQPPRPMNGPGGIKGLSNLPEEYHKWPPAYQHRFERVVNDLLGQGSFPDEFTLIEKAKGALEAEGFKPGDRESMQKLEEMEKAEGQVFSKDPGAGQKKPEK